MINMDGLEAYTLLEDRYIGDVHAHAYAFRHKKSGARIAVLANDDENKVFNIGFRTPPQDDTGMPHILEHSVLCGSKNFPVKDPFIELAKGSMNTFLNALTYSDKTVYPVASCNDKDFQNLMHVYLDAVFFTNIYEHEEIFRQEGWHYELDAPDGALTVNGVVYNEMKGEYSSPESVLERVNMSSLYPDTPYARDSGGDPAAIPTLKYSSFLGFHSKYYHPSNSYIYLYGNMDVKEKLAWIDETYLSKYDAMPIDSKIALQEPFSEMHRVTRAYSVAMEDPLEKNTYLSYNKVIGTTDDIQLCVAFQILEYVLLSAPGAPLRKALIEAGIGKDILGAYDGGIRQPYFSVTAKNADAAQEQAFVNTITDVLTGQVENGLDIRALEAAINYYEFRYREADYGSYSPGLMYGLDMFATWLYDDAQPFAAIELLPVYAALKEKIGTGYFEDLIRTYLLDNPHGSIVVLTPKRGLTAETEKETAKALAAYKATLSEKEIDELIAKTKALKAYQEEPSPDEALRKIPLLTREDLKGTVPPLCTKTLSAGDVPVLSHDYFTNGIAYGRLLFDLSGVPEELFGALGLLKAVLGFVDTAHYTYGELFNEINRNTGGIASSSLVVSRQNEENAYRWYFSVNSRALYEKQPFVYEMIEEILRTSKLTDTKRLYEIVAQETSSVKMHVTSAGHSAAVGRANACFSAAAYVKDATGGIGYYEYLKDLEAHFDERKDALVKDLQELCTLIFRKENLQADYTGEAQGYAAFADGVEKISGVLYTEQTKEHTPFVFKPRMKKEGFATAAKVQYVARTGNFRSAGLSPTGALNVLHIIMNYEYLWTQLRVLGGAYGCMSGFAKNGNCYFASYRDPHLKETNAVYENAVAYVEQFDANEREMTKYIIGALSEMDAPMTPSMKGRRSMLCYLGGLTWEELQKERDEVLAVTPETIRALSKWVRALLDTGSLCVIGGEEKLNECREMFDEVRTL